MAIVEEIVARKGKEVHVSNGWWESFRKRHPILALRSAEKLSYARLAATDPQIIHTCPVLPQDVLSCPKLS